MLPSAWHLSQGKSMHFSRRQCKTALYTLQRLGWGGGGGGGVGYLTSLSVVLSCSGNSAMKNATKNLLFSHLWPEDQNQYRWKHRHKNQAAKTVTETQGCKLWCEHIICLVFILSVSSSYSFCIKHFVKMCIWRHSWKESSSTLFCLRRFLRSATITATKHMWTRLL